MSVVVLAVAFASLAAQDIEEFYYDDAREQYGQAAVNDLAPLLARMDKERWFEGLAAPDFSDPGWGRLRPELRARLEQAVRTVERAAAGAREQRYRDNIGWLAASLRFALELEKVSAALAPAYRLKESGDSDPSAARRALDSAPLKQMFAASTRRVRPRGELAVLSALCQRVWAEHLELRKLLAALE